ncbi:MAG TPA: LppX_LprAFG lipoprotein [Gaiellaceae bacterium]|nr:LppX_LprAFG lipoprotein [Gaiellaceae bacterium]
MRRAVAVLVALPLALAACGSGGSSSSQQQQSISPVAYVTGAAKKTAGVTSEHVELNGSTSVSGQAVTFTGSGDFDTPSKQGALHMEMNAGGLNVPMDVTLDGTTVYVRSPLISDSLPKGKTWLSFDLAKGLAERGIDVSQFGAQRPGDTLAQMQAVGTARPVGDETLDGVETTHYRGTIDPAKIPQGAKVKALTGAKYAPYDIWIGKDDGLVHRMRFGYALKGTTMRFAMDFSKFGQDVNVTVPSASETVDATKGSH